MFRNKGTHGAKERYLKELIIGYSVPFLIVLLTGIVEASAPQCSLWKPRFLEEACWFAGKNITLILKKYANHNSQLFFLS